MGERLAVSVPVLLDAAGRTGIAGIRASEDLLVLARELSDARAGWPGETESAYSALLTAWESADAALCTRVAELAQKLQSGAGEYAEAERRTSEGLGAVGS